MKSVIITASILIPTCYVAFAPAGSLPNILPVVLNNQHADTVSTQSVVSDYEKLWRDACNKESNPQRALNCIAATNRQFPDSITTKAIEAGSKERGEIEPPVKSPATEQAEIKASVAEFIAEEKARVAAESKEQAELEAKIEAQFNADPRPTVDPFKQLAEAN